MPPTRTIFLSMVSGEFRSYRELLTSDLERCQVHVETQEKWGTVGHTTLGKLDQFLKTCGAVVHVVGDALGFVPPKAAVDDLLDKLHPDFVAKMSKHTDISRVVL